MNGGGMDEIASALLVVVAQLALGVAGFSGIAIYFKRRPGPLTEIEIYRIAILFLNSFAAMFSALVPFPLVAFGLSSVATWRMGSALVAVYELPFFLYYLPHSLRYRKRFPSLFNRYSLVLTYGGGAGNLALQTASALGLAARATRPSSWWAHSGCCFMRPSSSAVSCSSSRSSSRPRWRERNRWRKSCLDRSRIHTQSREDHEWKWHHQHTW